MTRSYTPIILLVLAIACSTTTSGVPAAPAPAAGPAAPARAAVPATSAYITEQDLERRLFLIAHDSMMGRETGSLGAFKAADYIAAEFRRLGLEPAGDNGTYFQTVP